VKYFIYFLKGIYQGKRYGLSLKAVHFGRMPDNQIVFPGSDTSVSRHHASLVFEKGSFYLIDLGSKNGTYINSRKLIPKTKNYLKPHDTFQIGSHLMQLLPINTQTNAEKEPGFLDKIGQQFSKGIKKLETIIMDDPFSESEKPKPESPSTILRETKPIQVNSFGDVKLNLLEKIAVGGMSIIYKAMFTDTKEIVAIKFPSQEVASDSKAISLFKEEIRMSLKFKHPNTIHTLMAITYNKLPTMVMEYFPSRPLTDFISRLNFSQANHIIYQAINGLESIHAKNIIHNDIKPGNIIVNESFQTKICDFGTAGELTKVNRTRKDWEMIGTPMYMSPEQLTPGTTLQFSSDIYELGLVMYEVFTHQHPYRSDHNTETEIRNKQLTVVPLNPCEINAEIPIVLGQLIIKAIQKDPKQRFQSIKDLKKVYENCF